MYKLATHSQYYGYWDKGNLLCVWASPAQHGIFNDPRERPYKFKTRAEAEFALASGLGTFAEGLEILEVT